MGLLARRQVHYPIDARIGQYCASFYPGGCHGPVLPVLHPPGHIYYLVGAGIRQFLDLGCGVPAATGNTHQIAQHSTPDSHVVYADRDPLVLAYAQALLTCGPPGRTSHLPADLNDPAALLRDARRPARAYNHSGAAPLPPAQLRLAHPAPERAGTSPARHRPHPHLEA